MEVATHRFGVAGEGLDNARESLARDAEAVRGDLHRRAEDLARLLAGRLLGREMTS